MRFNKLKITALALFISVTGFAQVRDQKDQDYDGKMNKAQFQTTYNFRDWDKNDDGFVDNNEFAKKTFKTIDVNDDHDISKEEWQNNPQKIHHQTFNSRTFKKWDSNHDRKISMEEYQKGISASDFFKSFDTDRNGKISHEELNTTLFNRYNTNRNGNLEKSEYRNYRKQNAHIK